VVDENKDANLNDPEKDEEVEQVGFTSSAEAKMVMYVIPVAIVLIIAAFLLSRCSG
jgi:hypothetical protein